MGEEATNNSAPGQGRVEWIGLRPPKSGNGKARSVAPMQVVTEANVDAMIGLAGDRFAEGGPDQRQVTFFQQEHLPAIASIVGAANVGPEVTRRNVLVSGVNLLAFEGKQFRVGDCVFLCTGPCEPCERMNTTLGKGGYDAMVGHGGIMTKVIEPGTIKVGDRVVAV